MEEVPNKMKGVGILIDHVLVLILHHLPACSLFCCKCVCRSWERLISHNNKLMPQTMAGFFYNTENGHRYYTSITGEHPSLSFLPFTFDNVAVLDCCNGLILCWCLGAVEYYRLASILLVRLDWGLSRQPPRTSM